MDVRRLCTGTRWKDCLAFGLFTDDWQPKIPVVGGQTCEHGLEGIPWVGKQSHVICVLHICDESLQLEISTVSYKLGIVQIHYHIPLFSSRWLSSAIWMTASKYRLKNTGARTHPWRTPQVTSTLLGTLPCALQQPLIHRAQPKWQRAIWMVNGTWTGGWTKGPHGWRNLTLFLRPMKQTYKGQ